MNRMIELIEKLSLLPGVSGEEDRVRVAIQKEIEGYCEFATDPLGNLIAHKQGLARPQNRIQISAHMDEVGFIITHIEKNGMLRFANVGGIDPAVVVGKPVLVGSSGIYGVVGMKPVHLLGEAEKEKIPPADTLLIDIGARDREEAESLVTPGERAVFSSPFILFGQGMIKGKALDDRAGCAIMIELIRSPKFPCDCTFTFTVQEENGCVGAAGAAYTVQPDIGIALETTTAGDLAETPEYKKVCRLGAGPVLSFMDRGTVYNRELYTQAMAAARECGIPVQAKEGVYGGNESRSIQTSRGGAKVLAVSLPCRYLHSPSCVLNQEDIQNTLRLLPVLLERFARQ